MGMNRKWNMRVFEFHDNAINNTISIPETEVNDNVYIDTNTVQISMQKYPFSATAAFGDNIDASDVTTIDIASLTADSNFTQHILDKTNWNFKEGSDKRIITSTVENDTLLEFVSVISARYDIPTNSTRWVLKFDLKTHPSLYRNFILFDGEGEMDCRYQYGIDIPRTGFPHLEHIINTTGDAESIQQTYADEQYFSGLNYMSVIICRWDNIYTIYYDNRYMITVPTEADSINRFGVWSWSGSEAIIKNPELFVITDDTNSQYVMITDSTSNSQDNELVEPKNPTPTP